MFWFIYRFFSEQHWQDTVRFVAFITNLTPILCGVLGLLTVSSDQLQHATSEITRQVLVGIFISSSAYFL